MDMLKRVDEDANSVRVLFSPWAEDLQPALCAFVGLTAQRLLDDGLSRKHVQALRKPLSWWSSLFEFNAAHWKRLRVTTTPKYFADLVSDLLTNAGASDSVVVEL